VKSTRLLGHHIHPMLIAFPLGLLSLFFDLAFLSTGEVQFTEIAYWNILAAVLGGLLAAVFGFWDYLTVSSGARAKRIARHNATNVVVVTLFAASWLMRNSEPLHVPGTVAQALSFVAVALAIVGGWLGGELVENREGRHRIYGRTS
jgi:uncharacterized membrane protein